MVKTIANMMEYVVSVWKFHKLLFDIKTLEIRKIRKIYAFI